VSYATRPAEETRQLWATQPEMVRGLEKIAGFSFAWDLAAEAWSAKAPRWCGPGSPWCVDTLATPPTFARLAAGGARSIRQGGASEEVGWLNPTWGNIGPWVDLVLRQGWPVALCVPSSTDSAWWHRLIRARAHLTCIEGRPRFIPPPGIKESSPAGGAVIWWTGIVRVWPESLSLVDILEKGGWVEPPKKTRKK